MTKKPEQVEKLFAAALNALSSHIAILDASGTIIAVNAAWCRFAKAHDLSLSSWGVGSNYLQLCQSAVGSDSDLAQTAALGISDVIARRKISFISSIPVTTRTSGAGLPCESHPWAAANPVKW